MNTATLIIIVSILLVLTAVLGIILQQRIRRSSPRRRYTIFAVLLGCGVSAQLVGVVLALVGKQPGSASLFVVTALLLSSACLLEMRKLSREF